MKKIFAVAVLFGLSSVAFASQTFVASQTTCAEIQSALKADGSVALESFFGPTTYYATPSDCGAYETATEAFEKTSDTLFCGVGYVCGHAHR